MPNQNFTNFDITIRSTIHNENQPPYAVTIRYNGHTATGIFQEDVTDPFWQQARARFSDPLQPPGSQYIIDAGSRLFYALMQDTVRDLWIRARTDLETDAVQGMRLRLALQPPPVAALPWECLYDPDRNQAFSANGQTPLVRVENVYRQVGASRSLRATLPIKLFLAVPTDPTGQIDEEQEVARLTELAATLGAGQIELQTLTGRFDLIALRRQLEECKPDILHIVTHGQPDGLLFWQRDEPTLTPASSLRVILQRTPSVKLAILNACLAGSSSEYEAFTTVGPQLLQAGLPAVIAMQFEIVEETAIDFAHFLYEELIAGPRPGEIDAAIGYTRSNLYVLNPNSFGYGTPVLWLNAEDGTIFSLNRSEDRTIQHRQRATRAKNGAETQESATHRTQTEQEAHTFAKAKVAIAKIAEWLATLSQRDETALSGDLLHYTTLRNRSVQHLHDLLQQIRALEADRKAQTGRKMSRGIDPVTWRHLWFQKAAEIQQEQTKIEQLETLLDSQAGQKHRGV